MLSIETSYVVNIGVDVSFRGADIGMAHQNLNVAQVCSAFNQSGAVTVAQVYGCCAFPEHGFCYVSNAVKYLLARHSIATSSRNEQIRTGDWNLFWLLPLPEGFPTRIEGLLRSESKVGQLGTGLAQVVLY